MRREVCKYRWEKVGLWGVGLGRRVSEKWSAGLWEVMVVVGSSMKPSGSLTC